MALTILLVSRDGLSVTRSVLPAAAQAGDRMTLVLRLHNRSVSPGIQVVLPNAGGGLDLTLRTVESASLPPRGEQTLTLPLRPARRGVHRLPPLRVETHDPLGLARGRRSGGNEQVVIVRPRLVILDSCLLVDAVEDRQRTRTAGPSSPGGLEFRGIRPHNPGEPLSRVDWKATARSGSLMLRETDDPANGDVTIVLDGTAGAVAGEPPQTSFELAVEGVAAIGDYLLRTGRTVNLIAHEAAPQPARLVPGAGARAALLERLAAVKADAGLPVLSTLSDPGNGIAFRRVHALVLVTSALGGGLTRTLTGLRTEGVPVSVLHVDRRSFPVQGPNGRSPSGRETMDSTAALLGLARAGVPCLTVGRGEDLRAALSRVRAPAGVAAR